MSETAFENVDDLPPIVAAPEPASLAADPTPVATSRSVQWQNARSGFAIALHMHQPLIPAGASPRTIISNLRFMQEHPEMPDAHNATSFLWCYKRMGEFIPQLIAEGKSPRIMLDYSGCLLHGLQQMGAHDVVDALQPLARDPQCQQCVEWLGTSWGHAVAPSTPPADFRLHVQAWQQHFAAVFGAEALARVRGFSPPEMALPNDPDVCYAFISTLKACGYRWVLVQEDTVEREDGSRVQRPHMPHRLIARNSSGDRVSLIAIIKTGGSDTKLVGQMQPFYEAKSLSPADLGGRVIPQLVTQIGDGENGGVMMNEFPSKFMQVMREASGSTTPPINVSEYLQHLAELGITEEDLPVLQPAFQSRVWARFEGRKGSDAMRSVLDELRREDSTFNVEGGSWTGDRSWVRGYEHVLGPMERASAAFNEAVEQGTLTGARYHRALHYLLMSQTSCFRYWGEGDWTNYGRTLCRMAKDAIDGRP